MIEQFPPSDLLQAKADFDGLVRLYLEQMGMVNTDIYINIYEQSASTVALAGHTPVALTLYEKYWDNNTLPSTMSIAGHTPLSVATWFNVLDIAVNKLNQYQFWEEYVILTPTPSVPSLTVEIAKKFNKPIVQTARLRDIHWDIAISGEATHLAERVEFYPLKPFTKPATNKLITQRANECLKAITRSGAWRVIRNAMYTKQRCITYTNTGH